MTRVVHGVSSQGELFDVPIGLTLIEKSTFRRSLATRNLYSSGIFIFFLFVIRLETVKMITFLLTLLKYIYWFKIRIRNGLNIQPWTFKVLRPCYTMMVSCQGIFKKVISWYKVGDFIIDSIELWWRHSWLNRCQPFLIPTRNIKIAIWTGFGDQLDF